MPSSATSSMIGKTGSDPMLVMPDSTVWLSLQESLDHEGESSRGCGNGSHPSYFSGEDNCVQQKMDSRTYVHCPCRDATSKLTWGLTSY